MFFSKMIKNKTASEIKRLEDEINRLRVEVGALRYSYSALEGTLEVHKCLSPFVEYKLFSPNYGSSSDKAQLIKDGYELCGISNINKAEVWKKK